MKQTEIIYRHLKDRGSITGAEAVAEYGIMRLASRIWDLKKLGIGIEKRMLSRKNRYGETVSFAEYRLVRK